MRSRLYLQIYLAFLAVVVVSIAMAMLAAHAFWERSANVPPQLTAMAELVVRDLPRDERLADALRERARELSADLTLWRADGRKIVASGREHDPPRLDGGELQPFGRGPYAGVHLELRDGRWLTISMRHEHHRGRGLPFGVIAVLLVAFMGIATFPVARRITRRLERLRRAVDRFGRGELKARVPVHGRDEVAQVARAFNRAADRIDALVEQQKRVLASASHELRAPLARLRVALELLLEPDAALPPERRARLLAECADDIGELDALVSDILLAARLERPEPDKQFADVDLTALIAREAERAGARFTAPPSVHGHGDARMLRRMLQNLLDNARKHGGGRAIEVALERAPGGALIAVSDDGPGVPEAERERIFEPFYRPVGHREARDGGVGLGLSLVRQIAEHHGGSARCTARAAGGSRFEVTLPGFT